MGLVDQLLWVLYAQSNCKGFGFHMKSAFIQFKKRIPRAVSDRKHGGLGVDHRAIRKDNAGQRSIFSTEGFYAALKTDFSAELYDFFPHLFYDIGQNICSDMRLCFVENFRLRAVFYKNRKDMSAASVFILDQSVQFAV